ncbi:hypothetical protein P0D69_44350 [Paraburkholderia sediminicola]|uniref:hypothetical protein n=1 Tax=Paraburkholderia sediminicola TaxID=458836 RepID=UPI0038BA6E5C
MELPVDSSDIVVNFDAQGHLHSIYNAYHYDIPDSLNPRDVRLNEEEAARIAADIFKDYRSKEVATSNLIVYQYTPVSNETGKPGAGHLARARMLARVELDRLEALSQNAAHGQPGTYYIAYDVRIRTTGPRELWRVLVDALTGHVLNVIDLLQYANGTVNVFDPNPIVTGGDITLRHTSPIATINAQRSNQAIDNLDAPSGGSYTLDGSHVNMAAEESPAVAEPTNATATFDFSWDDNSFLDAMAYFHINRFQSYVQNTLGINNAANYSIPVDPQGYDGIDNSHYAPGGSGSGYIAFGGGLQPIPASNPVPDAADAMVVLHEYGHAIQDNSNPNFDNPPGGTGEGFGDTLAAVYYDDKHANLAATRGFMMSWDAEMGTGSWPGRRYDVHWLFDGPEYTGAGDNHTAGQLWCATMFELYRKFGGDSMYSGTKNLALRLHLMANFNVPTQNSTALQMGQQIEAADGNLNGWRYANGLHKKVIYDTFRKRHLGGYPDLATDVFINDGRHGGYGSLTGNDLFTERQWLDVWWEAPDVWVTVVPYPDAASQQAGDPGDHVEPPVGSTAYLYVRVGNKGTAAGGSGPVSVRAFHADPGIGLTWPDDWQPMNTASIAVPNILPGSGGRTVVGPFPWTPTVVGHECVLAVVECANDHAVTQNLLATDHVADGDLVPFDNNIAQRNLNPTPANGSGKRKFVVRNPFGVHKVVELRVNGSLPKGWQWHIDHDLRIPLGPRESRWVELEIDQAAGEEVTRFDTPHAVVVTGLVDGQAIGGISFYLAPPSAFPRAGHGHDHRHETCCEALSLDIPWKECEFEGELELRLKFRKK